MFTAMLDPEDLKDQLQKALKECASLREENERLRKLLGLHPEDRTTTSKLTVSEPSTPYTSANQVINDSPIENQVSLFRSLFHGREDAYPIRWEGKKGNSGYSPASFLNYLDTVYGSFSVMANSISPLYIP